MEILASLAIVGFLISTACTKKALVSSIASGSNQIFHTVFTITLIIFAIYAYNLVLSYSIKLNFSLALMITFLMLNFLFFIFMFKKPICHLSLVLFPLTSLSILSTLLFNLTVGSNLMDYSLIIHIIFSLLSYGFLGLAALQAILLKYQGYKLKNVGNSIIDDILPSIEKMEKGMFELIVFGFFLLTLSLITGTPFVVVDEDYAILEKISFSVIAWIVYFYLIFQHFSSKVTGNRATNLALGGMIFLFIAYLGTKIIL